MTEGMPRKMLPFVVRERSRHGRVTFYFRRGKGERIRLPDDPTSDAFNQAYRAALAGIAAVDERREQQARSFRWLVERYKESGAWRQLSDATRYQRDKIFIRAIEKAGNDDFAHIDRVNIQRAVDRRSDTPAQANSFLKAMRGLFDWAVRNDHVAVNPCIGVERLKDKTDGFPAWTVDDVIAFRSKHQIGTKARLAMEFMLMTGLRRSDMAQVGRQHIRDGVLSLRTNKTGTPITIALPEYLLKIIESTPIRGMHLVGQDNGKSYTVESFGNAFREWCDDAKVAKSAHGLRKLSATLAAEGGAAAHELMAQYGWTKMSMAEIYTKGADRARLGIKNSGIVAEQIANIQPLTADPGAGNGGKKQAGSAC